MENQHRIISGYRELDQDEIDLMNEAKSLEARCLELTRRVRKRLHDQHAAGGSEDQRAENAQALHWLMTGRHDLETGFMALVRSIAQPQPREVPPCE